MPAQCVIPKDSGIYNHAAQVGDLNRGKIRKDLVHVPYTLHAKKNAWLIKGFMNKQYKYNTWPEEISSAKKVRMQSIKPQPYLFNYTTKRN
jgi:hypothetical protein